MHGMPIVWWIGQMVKYLVRPQPSMEEDMVDIEKKLKFKSPIVGYVLGNLTLGDLC